MVKEKKKGTTKCGRCGYVNKHNPNLDDITCKHCGAWIYTSGAT